MPFNSQGQWVPEDDSVATKLNALTASSSPYIAQARAAGLAGANRRGLLNSSMAQGAAEGAAIQAALPIASQDAQASTQKTLQGMTIASNDRNASLNAAIAQNQAYLSAFTDLANNKDIPAATRDAYIKHLQDTRGTGYDMVQQIYGINLDWGQSKSTPGAGAYGVVPTDKNGVQGGGGGYSSSVVRSGLLAA